MRDSVVFYRSFYEAVKDLPPDQFKACVRAIMDYGLDEIAPETAGIEKTVYMMAKPQIDANNKRYQNGTKGGRPSTKSKPNNNQEETKSKPNENQTKTKAEPNEKDKEKVKEKENDINTSCPVAEAPASPTAVSFALNDGSLYDVTENDVDYYQQLYPAIDVMTELRKIAGWCDANPKNRKTRGGAKRFLNSWMARAQDKAPRVVKGDGSNAGYESTSSVRLW